MGSVRDTPGRLQALVRFTRAARAQAVSDLAGAWPPWWRSPR
ncbi:hypothetical protein ACFXKC_56735 [Streptomyces sp. NPDC059340]